MTSVLVLNGPNLNLLGRRDPAHYGSASLADIERACRAEAEALAVSLAFEQSNHEGALVDAVHAAIDHHQGLVINAGAYTHTSIALRDAIDAAGVPAVELHLSNVHAREPFRHRSLIAPVCVGVISGLGPAGYPLAVRAIVRHLEEAS